MSSIQLLRLAFGEEKEHLFLQQRRKVEEKRNVLEKIYFNNKNVLNMFTIDAHKSTWAHNQLTVSSG